MNRAFSVSSCFLRIVSSSSSKRNLLTMSSFKDKVVLVTGASGGIGTETAALFAKRQASLVLVDLREEGLKKTEAMCKENGSPEVLTITADLTIKEDLDSVISDTMKHFNKLDVLVNNAGIVIEHRLEETSWEDFDRTIAVNIRAPFFLSKGFIPELIKTKGCVVSTSSVGASIPDDLMVAYRISKAGLDHLTKCLAQENAKYGVRVNSVNPGVTDTPMVKAEKRLIVNSLQPLGGIVSPVEIARWIVHLASEESGPITGQNIAVDGGRTVTRIPVGVEIPGSK